MTFDELQQLLRESTSDKRLLLAEKTTGVSKLEDLLEIIVKENPLYIEQAVMQVVGETIEVKGDISFLNSSTMPVTAVFHIDADENAQLKATCTVNEDWTFGKGYPNLAMQMNFDPDASGFMESPLKNLGFSEQQFIIASFDVEAIDQTEGFKRGLNYAAQLHVGDIESLEQVNLCFGSSQTISVSGLIKTDDDDNDFFLQAAWPDTIQYGDISFGNLKLWFTSNLEETTSPFSSEILISGEVSIDDHKLNLATELCIGSAAHNVPIHGHFENCGISLASLSQLAKDIDFGESIMPGFSPSKIYLTRLEVGMSPRDKHINYLEIDIDVPDGWEFLSGEAAVRDIHFRWFVNHPLDKEQREINADLFGTLEVEGVDVDVRASYPDFEIYGSWDADADAGGNA
ncbi:MAG: hypothetical protein MJA83_04910 [Gammaproteobacteria bacterium]|nr:hypothetical protein [Gammaproteobacteria bacterium]